MKVNKLVICVYVYPPSYFSQSLRQRQSIFPRTQTRFFGVAPHINNAPGKKAHVSTYLLTYIHMNRWVIIYIILSIIFVVFQARKKGIYMDKANSKLHKMIRFLKKDRVYFIEPKHVSSGSSHT